MHHHIPFNMFYPIVRYIWFSHAHYIYIHTSTSHLYHTFFYHHTHIYIYIYIYYYVYTYIIPNHIYIYIISRWLAGRAGWGRLHLHLRRAAAVPGRPTAVAQRPGLGAAAAEAAGDDGRNGPHFGGGHGSGWTRGLGKNNEKNDEKLGWEIIFYILLFGLLELVLMIMDQRPEFQFLLAETEPKTCFHKSHVSPGQPKHCLM